MNLFRLYATLILLVTLSACVTVAEPTRANNKFVISSNFEKDIKLDENSTFALAPLQMNRSDALHPLVTNAIEQYLKNSSLRQIHNGQQPTFYISYVLKSEKDLSDKALTENFGINPGLPAMAELKKGTLMILISDGKTKQHLWKGAAQGFAIDGLSDEDKKLRMQRIVTATFRQFTHHP